MNTHSHHSIIGPSALARPLSLVIAVGIFGAGLSMAGEPGKLLREVWETVEGSQIPGHKDRPAFYGEPTSIELISGVEPPSNAGDNYGQRLRGWIIPTVTGEHTFWIAGDDSGQLWLSTSESKFDKQRIAAFAGFTDIRQWDKYPSQKSVLLPLQAGEKYYLEVLHKEGTGGDHVSIAWQPPGGNRTVVPASVIESFSGDPLDLDDDDLPDAWEASVGLSAAPTTGRYGDHGRDGDPDRDGFSNYQEWLAGTDPLEHSTIPGGFTREVWREIGGTSLSALTTSSRFLQRPSMREFMAGADAPRNEAENYGQRLRGYVIIPEAGNYRFHVSGDDSTALWIAESGSHFERRRVAWSDFWTSHLQWGKYSTQKSEVLVLQEGQRVYLEALHKEGSGGDSLSIGWSLDGGEPALIPAAHLEAFATHPDDIDEDYLSDTWEVAHGFDVGDNGLLYPEQRWNADPDEDGFINSMEALSGGSPHVAGGNVGYVRRDIWTGVNGEMVADLTSNPKFVRTANNSTYYYGNLELGSYGDRYGQKLSGGLVPPVSGWWRFFIASDDSSELWLSDSSSATGKRKIAWVSGHTTPGNFDAFPSQKSAWVQLEADISYYYEVLHKESGGADHLRVAWEYQPVNWALGSHGSVATQSTTYKACIAGRAIDGNTNGDPAVPSASHTEDRANSWWQVDFGQDRSIDGVVLFNRTDSNKVRLSNFRVSVLDAANNELAGEDFFTTSGYVQGSMTWDLPQRVKARKVRVQFLGNNLIGNGIMCLAEVQACEWSNEYSRRTIAAPHLRTLAVDPLDLDGDSLPDVWEVAMGLDPLDNGSINPANAEHADPDGDGLTNFEEWQLGLDPRVPDRLPGRLLVERWNGISGYGVDALTGSGKFYAAPDSSTLEAPSDLKFAGHYFGTRVRGYITPETSGDYTFWISARNSAELWLSADLKEGKYAKRRIAFMDLNTGAGHGIGSNEPNLWDRFSTQRSERVRLEAGQSYYIETLHQNGHVGNPHVSIAWARDNGTREALPASVVSSYLKTPDDLDDDYLPDAWESQHGLDAADNGLVDPMRQGERGDFDGDGLSNREEYLLGTDPSNSDTDGDGVSDGDEVNGLGTDALVANAITDTLLGEIALDSFTSSSVPWVMTSGGLLAESFRGSATWDFSVPSAGNWLLRLELELMGSTFGNEDIPIVIKVDGKTVVRRKVRFGTGNAGLVQALTPWIAAGGHQVEIIIDNTLARRTVRLVSLELHSPANLNGMLAEGNSILPHAATTRTSPFFIEGFARDAGSVAVNGSPAIVGTGNGHWFSDISLADQNGTQAYKVAFEQGWETAGSITWQATNVMDGESLVIRQGETLRVGAWGTDPEMPSTLTLSSGGTSTLTGAETTTLTFSTAGSFTVTGVLQSGASSVLQVTVIAPPAFITGEIDMLDHVKRVLTVATGPQVSFEAPGDQCRLDVTRSGSNSILNVYPNTGSEFGIAGRLFAGGPILGMQRVNVITVSDALQNDLTSLSVSNFPGYKVVNSPLTVLNLPPGATIEVSIFRAGMMFLDGTTLKTVTFGDLQNGSIMLSFLYPMGKAGGYCHRVKVFDRNGVFLGNR